jgi:CRP-like cAMP-binding protein
MPRTLITTNALLSGLHAAERERLHGELEVVELRFKEPLVEQGQRIDHVLFPEGCIVSLLTQFPEGDDIETATIGREGVVGLSVFFGELRATQRAICQIPGRALRAPAGDLDALLALAPGLRRVLMRYADSQLAVAAQLAACNLKHSVAARMSRWLLTTHDRVDDDEFALTQEFLSQMLGITQAEVSVVGAKLQKSGLIDYQRGRIRIVDREGLERTTCGCYAFVRERFARAFAAK